MATGHEVFTNGQLTAVGLLVIDLRTALAPLIRENDIASEAWRGEVLGRLSSLRTVVEAEGKIGHVDAYRRERAEIHAALGDILTAIDAATAAVAAGELGAFFLATNGTMPVALGRFGRALDALTAAFVKTTHGGVSFAC